MEAESLSGINFSSIYYAFQYSFWFTMITVYLPRAIFYIIYLFRRSSITGLHWYLTMKSFTFFCLCFLGIVTLLLTFICSTMLTNTFGTGLAYMMILFMVPATIILGIDLYLCITIKYSLEERIWLAAPKVRHQRRNDDETEAPVLTDLLARDKGY